MMEAVFSSPLFRDALVGAPLNHDASAVVAAADARISHTIKGYQSSRPHTGTMLDPATIYFAFMDGPQSSVAFKIGITSDNPASRLNQIAKSVPWPIVLVATMPGNRVMETALHRSLKQHRLRGEWYRPSAAVHGLAYGLHAIRKPVVEFHRKLRFEVAP